MSMKNGKGPSSLMNILNRRPNSAQRKISRFDGMKKMTSSILGGKLVGRYQSIPNIGSGASNYGKKYE